MTALTSVVTYAWPKLTLLGGCSLTSPLGTTQDTAGSVPCCTSTKNCETFWMLPVSPSCCTVVNQGSGFQIVGTPTACNLGGQLIASSSSQSGSYPSAR